MKKTEKQNITKKIPWLRYSWGDRIYLLIVYAFVILFGFACLYPMYFTVIASFSDTDAVYTGQTFWRVKGFNTYAYEGVFQNSDIWRGYRNTIIYTVCGTLVNLALTIPTAYALSKKELPGRGFIMKLLMVTMYFGGGMIPTYIMYDKLGLVNNPMVMIIGGAVSVYNIIVTRTFFQNNIPDSLFEAARIDGANEFYIFGRIALPLSGAITAVMTLYYAVGHWNSYFSAMIYLKNPDTHPLQLVLRRILIQNQSSLSAAAAGGLSDEAYAALMQKQHLALGMKFSLVFIASLPMLIIYPFVQKYFVKGVMVGSVKG